MLYRIFSSVTPKILLTSRKLCSALASIFKKAKEINISLAFKKIKNSGLGYLFLANLLIAFFAFGSQLFVSGILEPSDLARIKIFQNYIQFASIFCLFGLSTTVIKMCSDERYEDVKVEIFSLSLIFVVILSILFTIILFILNPNGLLTHDEQLKSYLFYYPSIVLPIALSQLFLAFYQSQKLYKKFSQIQLLTKSFGIFSVVVGAYYFHLNGYMLFNFLSSILGLLVLYQLTKSVLPNLKYNFSFRISGVKSLYSEYLSYSLNSFITSFNTQINSLIGLFILSFIVKDLVEIGYYSFSLILMLGFRLLNQSVQQYLLPIFSSNTNERSYLIALYRLYNRRFRLAVLLIFITSFILLPIVIKVVFGEKYVGSISYVQLGLIFWLFYSFTTVKSSFLVGTGRIKQSALLSTIVMISSVILNIVLILTYGVLGAALADIINNIISYGLHKYYVNKSFYNES